MTDTNAFELPSETTDALDTTPIDTAGGGQFQSDWAASPEGQDYLAKSDDREVAYAAEEKTVNESAALQEVEPVNAEFVQDEQDAGVETELPVVVEEDPNAPATDVAPVETSDATDVFPSTDSATTTSSTKSR